jgi:hypothetical protein
MSQGVVVPAAVSGPGVDGPDERAGLAGGRRAGVADKNEGRPGEPGRPVNGGRVRDAAIETRYFFLAAFLAGLALSSRAAWAAASRATGTRNGEQLT